jgi:ElaB/YqjD/DUF883 family membrane-anchored ribosome-binding protein
MQTQNFNDMSMDTGAAGSAPTRDPAQRIDRAAQAAHDTVDRVQRRAVQLTDKASSEGERMYQATCSWISAHPMQAVGTALLAGYLFGRLRG